MEPIINGHALSEYTVVYAESNDCATYEYAAERFADFVLGTFGVRLAVCADDAPACDKEILIGLSEKRAYCEAYRADYGFGGYAIAVQGSKLVLAGSHATGCYHGMQALADMLKNGNVHDAKGEGKVLKVACVGDSITHGINSTDPKRQTYPSYLQEMLGYEYFLLNAGLSGLSVCKNDEFGYQKFAGYAQAKALVPDIVLFALGSNDANPNPNYPYKNWNDPAHDRKAEFIESAHEMLDTFAALNPKVQTVIFLPASLFVVGDDHWNAKDWTANIVSHVHPLLTQIAAEYGYPTIDLFDWSRENAYVFTDGLHPKDETYRVFAQYVYERLKGIIKKP